MSIKISERLRARITQLGLSAADVSRAAEVNRSFVYDILRGKSLTPNIDKLRRVAEALQVSSDWLVTGKGDIEGDDPITEEYHNAFVAIQSVKVRPSMGGGALIDVEPAQGRDYHFRRAWIRDRLKAAPSMLRVMSVEGDSMTPTLLDGDTVLVDMNQKSPKPPGVFVLNDGMGLVAKRLEYIPMSDPPRIRITSDNPQYSPYECLADEINIIGRVRWCGREM